MSETFGLEIYASNKLAYAGRAQKLIIPAVDGERGFLAHHANVVEAIRCVLRMQRAMSIFLR